MTRPRVVAVLVLAVVPWTVYAGSGWGGVGFVFPWGLLDTASHHPVTLPRYLAVTDGLPGYLVAWPVGAVLYVAAVASVLGGVVLGREDRRVTAGVLVLAAVSHLAFAIGFASRRPDLVVVPVGAVVALAVAVAADGHALRAIARFEA